jgi:hypothetical protein
VTGNRVIAAAGVALAIVAPAISYACGVCLEDKVAAVYDHAVVARAARQHHAMVFVEVRGSAKPEELVADARRVALGLPGVDRASVRAARSPSTVSFALDQKVHSVSETMAAFERSARGRFRIELLRAGAPT